MSSYVKFTARRCDDPPLLVAVSALDVRATQIHARAHRRHQGHSLPRQVGTGKAESKRHLGIDFLRLVSKLVPHTNLLGGTTNRVASQLSQEAES